MLGGTRFGFKVPAPRAQASTLQLLSRPNPITTARDLISLARGIVLVQGTPSQAAAHPPIGSATERLEVRASGFKCRHRVRELALSSFYLVPIRAREPEISILVVAL